MKMVVLDNLFMDNLRMGRDEDITHQFSMQITAVMFNRASNPRQARSIHLALPGAENLVTYTYLLRYDDECRLHSLFGTTQAQELIGKEVSVIYSNARALGFQVFGQQSPSGALQ